MKKILLSISAIAALTAFSESTLAQVFKVRHEVPTDTTKTVGTEPNPSLLTDIVINTYLDTEAAVDSFTFTFQIKELSLPSGWSIEGFCNNVTCYTPSSPSLQGPNFVVSPESNYVTPNTGVGTNETSKIYPWIHAPKETAAKGVGVLKLELKTVDVKVNSGGALSQTSEVLYIMEKTSDANSVAKISLDDQRIVVYPNPASDVVTIYADASLKANHVIISDVMGRTINTFKLNNAQTIHSINIADLNAGLYNLTILDAQGNILNTKKLSVN